MRYRVFIYATRKQNQRVQAKAGYYTIDSNSRILTRIITRRVIASAILPIKSNRVAYIIIVVSERGTYIWTWANYFYRSIRFFRNRNFVESSSLVLFLFDYCYRC